MTAFDMPGNVLQKHAYDNVWCTPDQDLQIRFKPARISGINGAWFEFTHMWRKIALPTKPHRYHIYQIGGIDPELLGLASKVDKWFSVPQVMAEKLVLVDVYAGNGFQIPRHLVYYRYTSDLNLIVAIRQPDVVMPGWNWEEDSPFIRLYSNAYFGSIRASDVKQYMGCISRRLVDRSAVQTFLTDVENMPFTQGLKYFYVNGFYAPSVNLATIANGDYVDCIYDSSIKRVVDFEVSKLEEFNSDLDTLRKYLLHYPVNGTGVQMIDYQDDVDCFIYRSEGNFTRGVYIHKNSEKTLRMVTHRDYSISIPVLDAAASSSGIFKPNSVRMLRMHVRHSGYERPLVFEASRIHELYRLKPKDIPRAMLGIDSTLDEWRANNLEKAMYTQIMRENNNGISREMVKEAYGYHAISKLIGDSPKRTELFSGKIVCKVPLGLWGNCTAYEFDANGHLLGWHHHAQGETYVARDVTTKLVEFVYGQGGETLDIKDDAVSGEINFINNYRFYYCDREFGVATNVWKPATEGMYLITGTRYDWVVSAIRMNRTMSNVRHLVYEFDYVAEDGLLRFNLTRKVGNNYVKLDMQLGDFDVWLNRKRLVENVDFLIKFPEVVIINTKHLANGGVGPQNIVVRGKGFCDSDMKAYPAAESGFVVHDTVSHNFHYNIREDHVLSINVGGKTFHKDDLKFAEDGVVPAALSQNNGKPYTIRNATVPINSYIVNAIDYKDPTYEMLEQAAEVDKRIEDYLSLYRPQQSVPDLNLIPERWRVISPFFTKIICDLRDGILWDDGFTKHYGSEYVEEIVKPYLPFLETDLAREDGLHDPRYVAIIPHPFANHISLGAYEHKFLRFVYKSYGRRVADIENFVLISND